MNKILCLFLFFQAFCLNSFSQNDLLEKDSLSVFIITDEHISAILDSFTINAQRSIYYPSILIVLYIDLYDNGDLSFTLDLRKKEHSDSIVLYKHPYYYQAFVLHLNELFQCNFRSYIDMTNYCKLTELLKKQYIKQCVYFKEPPADYYDNNRKGEIEYEKMITTWGCNYYDGKWQDVIKVDY